MLTAYQKEKTLEIWQKYLDGGRCVWNAYQEYSDQEINQERVRIIPEVKAWLDKFFEGSVMIEEFKTAIDGINKRNPLWGFRAINGQMYFNILTKNSIAAEKKKELTSLLQTTLHVPESIDTAKTYIKDLEKYTLSMAQYSADRRGAPKVGSIPYFLSYFWQIQSPEVYPIYYTSMIDAFRTLNFWTPAGNVSEDYADFYALNDELQQFMSLEAGRHLHIWDVEHAFWYFIQTRTQDGTQTVAELPDTQTAAVVEQLSEGYLPPIVSVLPRLAVNDHDLSNICQNNGTSVDKVFEDRLAILFKMLGYETEQLGAGHGRVPDGIAVSEDYRYGIIYDAKVRQQGYTMGTDERAIREYINVKGDVLRRRGIRNIYFMVISGTFSGDHDDIIRGLKIDTIVSEVLLVEVKALLAMLEGKLRNPRLSLGPDGIQRLLAFSGIMTENSIREFMEL